MSDKIKIRDLIQDDKNFNKGSSLGNELINKSIKKFGAGRSVLIDKNNRLIAGNKSAIQMQESGIEDVIIVETDGKSLVAVRRNDIDLDSPEGREMALADNVSSMANIVLDVEAISAEISETAVKEWHVEDLTDIIVESEILNEVIEIDKTAKRDEIDDFEEKFNSFDDSNCELPIVPEFFETHECFLIPITNEIDEKFIRDVFGLNQKHESKSGDKKVRLTNVISVEKVKKWAAK